MKYDKKPMRCGLGVHEEEQLSILDRMEEVIHSMRFKNHPGGNGQEGFMPFQVLLFH